MLDVKTGETRDLNVSENVYGAFGGGGAGGGGESLLGDEV